MADITYIEAAFGRFRSAITLPLYRYDHDVVLRISGVPYMPASCSVHFSNSSEGTVTEMLASDGDVAIPNALLETGLPVYAYFYVSQESTGRTLYKIKIPVKQKSRPDGEVTPTQADVIEQAISALNTSETNAAASAASAIVSAQDAEAWAVGQRDGTDVSDTDAAYHNNSKYYAEQAEDSADQAEDYAGAASSAATLASTAAETATGAASTASTAAISAQGYAEDADESAERAEMAANNAGFFVVELDARDHLIYTRTDDVDVDFSITDTGHLIMEA